MNSLIYKGYIQHQRNHPKSHYFKYPIIFFAININEIETLSKKVFGFSSNKNNLISLQTKDYLFSDKNFKKQLSLFFDINQNHKVILITVLRFLIPTFNPVSFYYILDEHDNPLIIIAEVNNTFGERHIYIVEGNNKFPFLGKHTKDFHVSPFNNMNGYYTFSFSAPNNDLKINIKLWENKKCIIDASLWGCGKNLNTMNLWKILLLQPFSAILTLPRIIKEAIILKFIHKLPIFKRPSNKSSMTIRRR